MNITPIKRGILRALAGQPKTLQEVSDKHWILYPSESSVSPEAIYLDGEMEKVTNTLWDYIFRDSIAGYDYAMKRIRGGMAEHIATTAYCIRNAEILDGYVYKGAMKYCLFSTKVRERLVGPIVNNKLSQAALACTSIGNTAFCHWITDDLPLTLAAQQLAEPITVARKPYGHEPEYRHLFGIQTPTVTRVKCDELIIITDHGQNKFKRQRYEFLRSRLKVLEPLHSTHGIMLRRGTSGEQRLLTNETEIEQFLKAQGFTIIDPEKLSATEIVRQVLGAKIVVGVEGSHMVHSIFSMADSGTLCVLQPPYRFNTVLKDYTDCLDMRYAFVVGKQAPNGFMIELEDLARTLDKIAAITP